MVIKDAKNTMKGKKSSPLIDPLSKIKPEIQEFFGGPDWRESVLKALQFIIELDQADIGCTTMKNLQSAYMWINEAKTVIKEFN